MGRKKLKHFAEMKTWTHMVELPVEWGHPVPSEPDRLSSPWQRTWGSHVILELGCGGGDYSLELAQLKPESTVVGVDIKGARLWLGGRKALELALTNVRFLRIRIESLARYFAEGEVDEIWVTFPNPHPNEGKERKRLTSPRFLDIYAKLLKPGGFLHLKTDWGPLFEYTVDTLRTHAVLDFEIEEADADVYKTSRPHELVQSVQTFFEKNYLAQGKTIKYIRARKNERRFIF